MNDTSNSIFWKEIFEQPEAVANCLAANREVCKQICAEVKKGISRPLCWLAEAPATMQTWWDGICLRLSAGW